MKNKVVLVFLLLMSYSFTAFAITTSVDFSVASGNLNSEVYVLGVKKIFTPFYKRGKFSISPTLGINTFLINPQYGHDVYGASITGGFLFSFNGNNSKTYLSVSSGPSLFSRQFIDTRDMGGHFQFASTVALGFRFGGNLCNSFEAFLTHYSHAGINGDENPGFNMFGLTYRYYF